MESKDVTFCPLTIQMQLRNMLGWKTIQKQLDLIRLDTVSRESAKKKFVNAVKRGWYHEGDWVPTQSEIPDRIGIRMQDVVTELRDELVKEGKIIQDPQRYWMCKVEENPGLLKGE